MVKSVQDIYQLCPSLPAYEDWKCKLDEFLIEIPDNLMTGTIETGLCNVFNSRQTNSLLRWSLFLGLGGHRGDDIVPDFNLNYNYDIVSLSYSWRQSLGEF